MRAWEILEGRKPRTKTLTLKALHQQKLVHAKAINDKERHASLVRIMYRDTAKEQELLELERLRLELQQMKAEFAATKAERRSKTAEAISDMAADGIKAENEADRKIATLAKRGLGRRKKCPLSS